MKKIYLLISLFGLSFLSAAPFIWIPDNDNELLFVIDGTTNEVIHTISASEGAFSQPFTIAITPNNRFVYVANNGSVSVIDAANYQLVTVIDTMEYGSGMAISPNGNYLYLAASSLGVVTVIDTSTNTIVHTINGFSNPYSVAFSADSSYAYVTDLTAGTITKINTADYSTTIPFSMVESPYFIAIAPSGASAYVASSTGGFIAVLNLLNDTETTIINLPTGSNPTSIAFLPNGETAYVADYDGNHIYVIDAQNNTLLSEETIGYSEGTLYPFAVAITPDGESLYAVNYEGPIAVFSTTTRNEIASIDLGNGVYYAIAIQGGPSIRAFSRPSNRR